MSLTPSSSIESPCVRNCCLNDDDICLGCGRSLQEITRWSVASNLDKQKILLLADERRQLIRARQRGY
ncbi:MAG: DUF1289 domain-containing protein [Cellvibrio sp.]